MTTPDDLDLIQAISRQDSGALMELYDRYHRICFAVSWRILADATLAEEAVQDAFMQVWNRASTFNPDRGTNVRGWLLTILHNRSIDLRRRTIDRRPNTVTLDDVDYRLSVPDVWAHVSEMLTREQVRSALTTLPDEQRRAIELAYFDGLTHGEIAAREGIPLGTVKGRLRLGLKKLSIELQTLAAPDGQPTTDSPGQQGEHVGTS
ncbi:MAG: sigma-70 family RNA polymerase sigma factor [Thermomicrobiales bacterium]